MTEFNNFKQRKREKLREKNNNLKKSKSNKSKTVHL